MAQRIGDIEQETEEHKWVYGMIYRCSTMALEILPRNFHGEQLSKENQGLITNYHYLADLLLKPSNLSRPIANASVWSTVFSLNAPSVKWYLHLRLMPTAWSKYSTSCWSNTRPSRQKWIIGRSVLHSHGCALCLITPCDSNGLDADLHLAANRRRTMFKSSSNKSTEFGHKGCCWLGWILRFHRCLGIKACDTGLNEWFPAGHWAGYIGYFRLKLATIFRSLFQYHTAISITINDPEPFPVGLWFLRSTRAW